MTHQIDMVMDFQYGSTGKGLIAGYIAKRGNYDTAICSFAVNAGHTYIDEENATRIMTQQLPTAGLVSPTVKTILIGPGALIHGPTLHDEIIKYADYLKGKTILIHPNAAVIEEYHIEQEIEWGMSKIGSTVHGVGAAAIERIKRNPDRPNIASVRFVDGPMRALRPYVATVLEYTMALHAAENVIIEGAQGFSLSMYHGQYPYTTSRDVTPWQIAADCGVPYKWASYIRVIGTMRCFPIRVNNRDGSSGPCYKDQLELNWETFAPLGIKPELTTVTKLPRRIFTFSSEQAQMAAFHCGGYWDTRIFLNFANYCLNTEELHDIIKKIEEHTYLNMNPPKVAWLGYGPDDSDIVEVIDNTSGR